MSVCARLWAPGLSPVRFWALPCTSSPTVSTPMVPVRRARRLAAARLGRYPSLSTAFAIRERVGSLTYPTPEKYRETVWAETPAARPTSAMLARSLVLRPPGAASRAPVADSVSSDGAFPCATPTHFSFRNHSRRNIRRQVEKVVAALLSVIDHMLL